MTKHHKYLSGEKLFGDDFDLNSIENWFLEEKEGYANLGSKDIKQYQYEYHELNKFYGYSFLSNINKIKVLSIGGAYGDEILPILEKVESLTILEPSEQMRAKKIGEININYLTPRIDGIIELEDNLFDLVTCFGVLHHIPNVSFVLSEMKRILKPGGIMLIREPIISMGDWNKPRTGLTKNERGIPLKIFREIIKTNKLNTLLEKACFTKPLDTFRSKLTRLAPYNNPIFVKFDLLVSNLLFFNYRYHAKSFLQKIRPTCVYLVIQK